MPQRLFAQSLLALTFLFGCAESWGLPIIQIKGQIDNNTYTNPSSSFRIKIPLLTMTGAKIWDDSPTPGVWMVSLSDDFFREYIVSERQGDIENQSIDIWVAENVVPALQRNNASQLAQRVVATRYGPAVVIRYRQPESGPRSMFGSHDGKRVHKKLEADVGMYILYHCGHFYRLIYVLNNADKSIDTLGAMSGIKRAPIEDVLNEFFEGFEALCQQGTP